MKTRSFKLLRAVCYLGLLCSTLATFSYLFILIYNYKIVKLEKSVSGDTKIILSHLSVSFIYMNLLLTALNGYAFNLGSKILLRGCMWLTCIITAAGLGGILYLRYVTKNAISILIQRGTFANGMILIMQNALGVATADYIKIQSIFMSRYENLLFWFTVTELTSCVCFGVVISGAAIRQFMKVHVVIRSRPNIVASVVEPISLRKNSILVGAGG